MDLSQIKTRISCPDYLRSQGISVPSRIPGRMISPLRAGASNPTSFLIQDDHWYDFGSGNGGDVIDLAAQMEFSGDLGKAIHALTLRLGLQINHPGGAWHDAIQKLCNRAAYYHSKLTDSDRDYLHNRGFTDATIDEVMIGHVTDGYLHGRLFLPYFKNDYVCYYATRAMPGSAQPSNKYMKAALDESPYYEHIPWGLPTLSRTKHPGLLVISEGYFDALSWYQEGYCVLSAITGRFSKDQLSTVLAACNSFDRVLIIYDNDPVSHAGAGFTQTMAEWLFRHHIDFLVGHTQEGVKDVNEFYAPKDGIPEHHADLSSIVNDADDGLSYLAKSFKDIKDMERFINTLKRYISRAELINIVSQTAFPNEVKKELVELVRSTPKESYISEVIRNEHKLAYISDDGFYEWTGKIWESVKDDVIRQYADSAYGPAFLSAQRGKQMLSKLQPDCLVKEQFNKKPIITFQNGTLEIDTGIFRDFNPEDYASIIMDYNYDPDAKCPQWENFINSITDGDPRKYELLQQIAGYVLSPTCDYQKIFILLGSGSNGKTQYTEILEAVFGLDNTSHVEPTGLPQDFQRILIKDSLLNIGADISSDFSKDNIREYLLKISDGLIIQACYKGKDYIKFRPRCKLIFACNELPYAKLEKGLSRRLQYVKLDMEYVENPDPSIPNQRQKDKDLKPKLLTELPGIFNWAYAGYKLLNTVGYFTDTNDQEELTRDFELTSDPVKQFIDDTDLDGEYSYDELFDRYIYYCQTHHYDYPRNMKSFTVKLKEDLGMRIIDGPYRRRVKGERKWFIKISPDPHNHA